MGTWFTLLFFAVGGFLLGLAVLRMRLERTISAISSVCISFGAVNILINGSILAHKLGLI